LPLHVEQTITKGAQTFIPYQEDFSAFELSPTAYPDADFEYAPAANQTVYVAPADPNRPPLLANGAAAPEFSATTADGKTVKLSDFAGKPVVLDFWATWCGPCQKSLPITNKLAAEYGPKGVVFLGLCSWDAHDAFTKWQATRSNWGIKFAWDPAGEDQAKSIATTYSVSGIPTQYFIGKDGKIVASVESYDPSDRHLRKLLDKLVATP
jgi:thiol-disulfide isomerase/thioredoxin